MVCARKLSRWQQFTLPFSPSRQLNYEMFLVQQERGHFIQSGELLFCPPPSLGHQTAAEQQVHEPRRDESIPLTQIFIPYDQGMDFTALLADVDATLL